MCAKFTWMAAAMLVMVAVCEAKVFSRCEFVRKMRASFPANEVADWVCLAKHESNLNTAAINVNAGGKSRDHGIFQINDVYWCSPGKYNICKTSCASLRTDDITKAIKCAKTIKKQQGFKAWVAWNRYCKGKNLSSYVSGC